MKLMQIKHLAVALALATAAPFAAAAFQAGMTVEQAEAEVKAQLAAGATLAQIVANAQKAPLNPGLITTALINATDSTAIAAVVEALLRAGVPLQVVVNAALAAGASPDAVTQGALAAGVQLSVIVAAIAASPTQAGVPPSCGGRSGIVCPGGSSSPS